MPARSSKKDNRDATTDGHSLAYYRSSFTKRDQSGGRRNRRGGGSQPPSGPAIRKVPAGTLLLFIGDSNPDSTNYAVADGSAVSRTTYSELFSAVSTTFGSGDGSTTFNLPDLSGHAIRHTTGDKGVESTYAASTHSHGTLLVASGYSQSGNSADQNNTVRNAVNNATTSSSGTANSHKFRDHDVLPLISLQDCQLPVGALLYTFRNLSTARTYCTVLSANGASYAAGTYGDLYSVTGTSYGGSASNPNCPDYRGCFPKCNKTYSKGNNYSTDNFPQHAHGPWTGVDANSTSLSSRQDGPSGAGSFSANGTTNSAGIGDANEMRGSNVAAHPVIVAENSTTSVAGLGDFDTNSLEPGDIIFYLGSTVPNGFHSLSGGSALSKATYKTLGDSLESNFIDGDDIYVSSLDGRYMRGVDGGASRDPNASSRSFPGPGNTNGANATGTTQGQSLTGHTHTFYAYGTNQGNNQYPGYNDINWKTTNGANKNSYGTVYNTNVTTNTNSSLRIPDIKVEMCMVTQLG